MSNPQLRHWPVIEIFDSGVPEPVLATLERDTEYVHHLMWDDLLFYHGEDGWVLSDSTLEDCEPWLDQQRDLVGMREQSAFWMRVKRS